MSLGRDLKGKDEVRDQRACHSLKFWRERCKKNILEEFNRFKERESLIFKKIFIMESGKVGGKSVTSRLQDL